jgi:hypothetical protein
MRAKPGLKLTAVSLADAAKALSAASGRSITEPMIQRDIDSGAPVNADGTINLVYYAAWLAREIANGSDESSRA